MYFAHSREHELSNHRVLTLNLLRCFNDFSQDGMKTKLEHRQRTTTKKTTSTSPTVGYWKYLQTTCSQQCHLHSSTTLSSPLAIWTSFDIALLSITSSFPGSWLLATEPANTKVLHHRMRRERQ